MDILTNRKIKSRGPSSVGFTLLELMAVLVIIGIFSALAIPGIMQVLYRNALTDSVERVRSAGGAARDLAMRTRQAAVLEVTSDGVWVNLLTDAPCHSNIESHCVPSVGGYTPLFDATTAAARAKVSLCGGSVLSESSDICDVVTQLDVGDGFALCYSGSGELYYRLGSDANSGCSGSSAPEKDETAWVQACSTAAPASADFTDNSTLAIYDGAALMLNRYEGTACGDATDAMDERRLVFFPTNGAPYSQVGGEEGADDGDTDTN